MVNKEVVVVSETGLHARPATLLVKKASGFKCDVTLEYNGKKANAKSLIGVLSLGVTKGASVNVITNGEDEVLAVEELATAIESITE